MQDMRTIDARGFSCPQPALMTQQAIRGTSGGTIQVLVDSATARDNVVRVAQKEGWQATIQDSPSGGFVVELKK